MKDIQIEVFIPSYNHEKFIERAINSVLEQKSKYDFKIVVSDDFSTDNTASKIKEISSRFKDRIINIENNKNVGMMQNYYNYLNNSNADIILFCEGDDEWIDINKLQKQVDFLMENEFCGVVFCSTENIDDKTEKVFRIAKDVGGKGKYYLNDILPHNSLNTLSSVAIRNTIKKNYPSWYKECNTPDGPLYFALLGSKFYIYYMDFVGTRYRVGAGTWSGLNKIEQQKMSIETYNVLLENLPKENHNACKISVMKSLLTLAKEYRKIDINQTFKYSKMLIKYNYFGFKKWLYVLAIPLILIRLFD